MKPKCLQIGVLLVVFFLAGAVYAQPYMAGAQGMMNQGTMTGWWYDPVDDGNGMSIEMQNNKLFMAWYTYDSQTGEPIWLTSGGTMTAPDHYSGTMVTWMGWPLEGTYTSPQSQPVGTIDLTFYSGTDAEVAWTMGAQQGVQYIERFMDHMSPGARDTRNIHGWWFNPDLNGMGIFMEAQGGQMFMAWYHYGDDGTPRWWSSGSNFSLGAMMYSGMFDQWQDGNGIGGAYMRPHMLWNHPANASVQFLSDSQAVLMWNGNQMNLERFRFDQIQ
jgi:hypothetical protein